MGRKQGPKVMAYFLFMQEQRQRVPGWSNRSNAELQRLCDPLWKALSKEEKAVYKEKKRSLRRTERENRLQLRIPQEAKRVEFEGKRWTVRVGRVESPDLIWVVPDISDLAVQRLMSDIAAAPLEVFQVGQLAGGDFSKDGNIYRARVMPGGNLEKKHSLASLFPLAVRVHLASVKGARNTEKNRARVEARLSGGQLTVCLDKRGAATFFKDGQEVVFRRPGAVAESTQTESDSEETSPEESSLEEDVKIGALGDPKVGPDVVGIVKHAEVTTGAVGCRKRDSSIVDTGYLTEEEQEDFVENKHRVAKLNLSEESATLGEMVISYPTKMFATAGSKYNPLGKKKNDGKRIAGNDEIARVNETTTKKKSGGGGGGGECWQRRGNLKTVKMHHSGWKVGDEIIALWEEEQVWRHGVIHELSGSVAFVVCMDEPMVKATMVPVKELCSALVPLHVLNKENMFTRNDNGTPFRKKMIENPEKDDFTLVEDDQVEDAVGSLLLPGALLCSSAPPLISVLLPVLSNQQKIALSMSACQDLSDLAIHQPSTLEVLFPLMKQDLASMVSSSTLVDLSKTEAGQGLLSILLPLVAPQKLALLASDILDHCPLATCPLLISMLLPLVDSQSVTFCLLSEAILGSHASQARNQAGLVNQLLEFKDKDVAARIGTL